MRYEIILFFYIIMIALGIFLSNGPGFCSDLFQHHHRYRNINAMMLFNIIRLYNILV